MKRSAMRRTAGAFAVVARLISSAALAAAPEKAIATFEPLGASGITGDADLRSMNAGGTQIHAKVTGLLPNTEYVSVIYQGTSCVASGSDLGVEFATFTSNPAGIANFNAKVVAELDAIGSVAIRPVSGQTVLACGAVTPVQ